jgi:hypothetical protein
MQKEHRLRFYFLNCPNIISCYGLFMLIITPSI